MKNITFFLTMLLSITAFSQVEIIENFDSTPDFDLPIGWTESGFFRASTEFPCSGNGLSATTNIDSSAGLPGSIELISPNYVGVTNNTDLTVSFTLNVFERTPFFVFPASLSAPLTGWGNLTLEYSLDDGISWIAAYVVDESNFSFIATDTCVDMPEINLGPLAVGSDFKARFVATAENVIQNSGNILVFIVDNVSIAQVATTVPNCDVTLISPTAGSDTTDLDNTITWQAASGIPSGYTVSIGTSSGGTDILNAATTASTSYSLSGLGLAYNTQYFVNIVPYNSFGDATGCTEESFTTRLLPIQGATCSNPFQITLPTYVGPGQDTSTFENNINEGPCGNYSGAFIDGYDVFYEITPTTDISINITLAQANAYGAAVHVMEGCPDGSSNCVALVNDDFSTTPPYDLAIEDVVLFAGNTYFIVISSAGFDSNFVYSLLLIDQNSCINPEFSSLTPVADCASNEFSVDVDVSSFGDATSLTLSDNFGNSVTGINAIGTVNIGPYASTSTVEFTLTNEQDVSCSFTGSTFFYCPPVNDDCLDSIALTVNTDGSCNIFTSAINAGATENASNPINCDFTNNNDIWFNFVATKETIILEYLNLTSVIGDSGTLQSTELLEGSCGSFTSLACLSSFSNYLTLNNLTIGNTYYIRNNTRNEGQFAHSFDICLREAPAAPVNDECANATILTLSTDDTCNNQLSGTTAGATPSIEDSCNDQWAPFWKDVWYEFTAPSAGFYKFSFERPDMGYDPGANYFIYSGSCGAFVEESSYCGDTNDQTHSMSNGEVFYIMVRSGDDGPGVDFNLCVYQLPPAVSNNDCSSPIALVVSTDANGNNAISGNFANSYSSSETCDPGGNTIWYTFTPALTGTHYFDFTATNGYPYYSVFNTNDCSLTSNNFVPNSGCYGSGLLTTDLVAGTTYLISIYSFDTFNNADTFDFFVYPDATLSLDDKSFESLKYFPNPVTNALTVEAKNLISNISIYNIVGQQVQELSPNSLRTTIDMNKLNRGVYFLKVTINETQQIFKVIKE